MWWRRQEQQLTKRVEVGTKCVERAALCSKQACERTAGWMTRTVGWLVGHHTEPSFSPSFALGAKEGRKERRREGDAASVRPAAAPPRLDERHWLGVPTLDRSFGRRQQAPGQCCRRPTASRDGSYYCQQLLIKNRLQFPAYKIVIGSLGAS